MSHAYDIRDLRFSYGSQCVIDGISTSFDYGTFVSVLGKNGAGKSTLFKCMLGLRKEYEGEINVDGCDIRDRRPNELAKKIAYIPQLHTPTFNYTVFDMVLMGAANQISSIGSPSEKHEEKADAALGKLGIAVLADKPFNAISGGEQQLVYLARAVMQDARIWILDEPLASLDFGNQIRVLNELRKLADEGYLIIQSIHNPDQACRYSDTVVAIHEGKIYKSGTPDEVVTADTINTIYELDEETACRRWM